jgi:hypothetical protein
MRSLLHHARVSWAYAALHAPAHFRQLCFLLAALLLAAQLPLHPVRFLLQRPLAAHLRR